MGNLNEPDVGAISMSYDSFVPCFSILSTEISEDAQIGLYSMLNSKIFILAGEMESEHVRIKKKSKSHFL